MNFRKLFLITISFCFVLLGCSAKIANVKEPNVAGAFYPDNKNELRSLIKRYMNNVPQEDLINRKPWAIISPHAGYIYSGQTAAFSYKAVSPYNYDTVIVLAPSHILAFKGAAIYPKGLFRTPLGDIPVDEGRCSQLLKKTPLIKDNKAAFAREHSLEVQLPFLQEVQQDFKLVSLIIGDISEKESGELSKALLPLIIEKNSLLVISTDMSHYHDSKTSDQQDEATIELIKENNITSLVSAVESGASELCGIGPVLVGMKIAEQLPSNITILDHSNSGDSSGDYSKVVGYMSAVYLQNDDYDE